MTDKWKACCLYGLTTLLAHQTINELTKCFVNGFAVCYSCICHIDNFWLHRHNKHAGRKLLEEEAEGHVCNPMYKGRDLPLQNKNMGLET